jgi:hypothetical protein
MEHCRPPLFSNTGVPDLLSPEICGQSFDAQAWEKRKEAGHYSGLI